MPPSVVSSQGYAAPDSTKKCAEVVAVQGEETISASHSATEQVAAAVGTADVV